jgi:hypothetical protein
MRRGFFHLHPLFHTCAGVEKEVKSRRLPGRRVRQGRRLIPECRHGPFLSGMTAINTRVCLLVIMPASRYILRFPLHGNDFTAEAAGKRGSRALSTPLRLLWFMMVQRCV